MSSLNYMELCRLCLVKERVSIPIFEGEGNVRQIFLKIASCLPVKVARDDKLPKKICSDCMYKLDNAYQFWNTTANAEKQLLQWLGEIASDDKKSVPSNTIETEQLVLKEEAVEQDQGSELAKGLSRVEAVLADDCKGGSEDEDESESEDEGSNSEDSGEDDGGEAPSKEEAESDEEPYGPLEPTTFVNVSLAGCDEAGPSGMQQQQQEQQQQEQQHHQQEQQQGPQQSQSLQQVQQSSQSQFLTPGAPSTSTAAPTSASGFAPGGVRQAVGAADANSSPNHSGSCVSGALEGRLISCKLCWKEFPESDLEVHSMFHCIYGERLQSTVKFESISKMSTNAIEILHSDIPHSLCDESPLVYGIAAQKDRMFSCGLCTRQFKRTRDLIVHGRTHIREMNHKCDLCGYSTTNSFYFRIHMRRHATQYNCDVCGKGCHTKSKLEVHKASHGGKPFRCLICDRQYACKKTLFNHKKMFHSDAEEKAKFHACNVCGKAFPKKSSLLYHSISHSGQKPYKCDQCDKAYQYKYNLATHKKTVHSDSPIEKVRHQCEMCGKTYAHKRSLLLHMNSHTGANVYICDVCGKSLSNKDHLKSHCRIHTGEKPNKCDICGKAFRKPFDMKQHRRIHTGERPYKCDLCTKAFTQQSTLVIHRRYHTGQRPYQCELCDKDFICRAFLNVHMKSHAK